MFALPRRWRRSIQALAAAGTLLLVTSKAVAIDIPVLNTNDSGIGSLRSAIQIANQLGGNNTIVFGPNALGTITLTTGALPPINSNVNIQGPGAGALTIQGTTDRIFFVNSGTVQITNLTLTNGFAHGGNGGSSAGGGLGAGGALFVNQGANVSIGGVQFGANSAVGGSGGNAIPGAGALGGGGGGGLGKDGGNGGNVLISGTGAGTAGGSLNNRGVDSTGAGGAGGGGAGGRGGNATTGAGAGGGGSGIYPSSGNAGGGGPGGTPGNAGGNGNAAQGGGGGGSFSTSGVAGSNGGNGGPNGGGGGGGGLGLLAKGGDGGAGGFGAGGGGGGGKLTLPNVMNNNGAGGAGGYGGGGGAAGFSSAGTGTATGGVGGFGAGNGGVAGVTGGNGGSALGGAVFVRQGGNLTLLDTDLAGGNNLAAGAGGAGTIGGTAGTTAGKGIYLDQVTLAFANTSAHTIADEIGGTGGVKVNGTGNVILTAANTYSGPTTVNSGVLTVNGSIVSDVMVNSTGLLAGNGIVGSTTLMGGGISPGAGINSIGTLTVAGNYVQRNNGVYFADINANGQSDRIAVTGTAKINDGILAVIAPNGRYFAGETFKILTANGGVSGHFTAVTSNALPGFLTPTVVYKPSEVDIVLNGPSPTPGGNTTNVTNIIFAPTAGPFSNVPYASLLTLGRLQALFLNQVASDQIRSAFPFAGVAGPSLTRGQAPDASCPTLDLDNGCRSWLKAYGLTGTVSSDAGFAYQFVGFMGGVDKQINDDTRGGVYAAYNKTTANFTTGSAADADGFLLGAYGSHSIGDAYVFGSVNYTFNGFGTTGAGVANGMTAGTKSSVDQNSWNDYTEVGYTVDSDLMRIQPMIGLQYLYLNQNGFLETTAGQASQFGSSQKTEALWLSPGFRLSRAMCTDCGLFAPQFHAQYVRDLIAENRLVTGSLSSVGGTILTQGAAAGRDFLVTGGGFVLARGDWMKFILDYTLQTSGARQTSHTGSGSIQLTW